MNLLTQIYGKLFHYFFQCLIHFFIPDIIYFFSDIIKIYLSVKYLHKLLTGYCFLFQQESCQFVHLFTVGFYDFHSFIVSIFYNGTNFRINVGSRSGRACQCGISSQSSQFCHNKKTASKRNLNTV